MIKVAISSHLKPIDDQRHYSKLAISMSKTNKYDINIIGFGSKNYPNRENITFHSILNYKNRLFNRLTAGIRILKKVIQLKPKIWIGNHPEILPFMIVYKILFGGKIVYDVQENYYYNLKYQGLYYYPLALLMAALFRYIEYASRPFVSVFILAEKVYLNQLSFTANKCILLENKALYESDLTHASVRKPLKRLIFNGNLSEISGVEEAIALFKKLTIYDQSIELVVVGHTPSPKLKSKIEVMCSGYTNIHLKISTNPIPYFEILNYLKNSDIGMITYKMNLSNLGKYPTKYFEYNALKMPYLIIDHLNWEYLKGDFGLIIHPDRLDFQEIIHFHQKSRNKSVDVSSYLWESQQSNLRLLNLIFQENS